jgi:hypothetical protein
VDVLDILTLITVMAETKELLDSIARTEVDMKKFIDRAGQVLAGTKAGEIVSK